MSRCRRVMMSTCVEGGGCMLRSHLLLHWRDGRRAAFPIEHVVIYVNERWEGCMVHWRRSQDRRLKVGVTRCGAMIKQNKQYQRGNQT